jgi:radical SAM protein with 4Fe4S-binding SPASM domain
VYGLTVYTTGQQLDDSAIAAMVANQMDAVVVHLDAWTQETYARIHGGGELGVAVTAIERLVAAREAAHAPAPLIVPQFTKSKLNVHELDAFYDGWIRRIGAAVVAGHAHYAGTLEELGCIDMTPPARAACRRLSNRLMVLADGSITACDQDVTGGLALGHLATHTLRDVWNGPAALKLRASHAAGAWSNHSPCNRCAEWHRP